MQLGEHEKQPLAGQLSPQPAQGGFVVAAGHQGRAPLRGGLAQEQVPGQGRELPQSRTHVLAVGVQPAQGVQGGGGVTGGQLAHQVGGFHAARKAQGV